MGNETHGFEAVGTTNVVSNEGAMTASAEELVREFEEIEKGTRLIDRAAVLHGIELAITAPGLSKMMAHRRLDRKIANVSFAD